MIKYRLKFSFPFVLIMCYFLAFFFFQKPENSTDITVGSLIAIMVEEGDDWQNVEVPVDEAVSPASEAPPPAPSAPPTSAPVPAPVGDIHASG